MKVIDSIVPVKWGNYFLLINTLNGAMIKVNQEEFDYIKKQQKSFFEDENGSSVLLELKRLGFVVQSDDEEHRMKDELIKKVMLSQATKNSAIIVLTYSCNFSCPYCYEGANENKLLKVISKSQIDRIMDICNDRTDCFTLFGGEPLLPETRDIIEYIGTRYPDKTYSIVSNGYYLEEFLPLLCKLKIGYIQITVDGNQENHNQTRILKGGAPTYNKIMSGIGKALKNGLRIKVRMNLTIQNYRSCIEVRDLLKEKYREYKEFLFFELSPLFQIDGSDFDRLTEAVYEDIYASSRKGDRENYHVLTDLPIVNYVIGKEKFYPIVKHCIAHGENLIFDSEGDIYSCIIGVGNKKTVIGTYYPKYNMYKKSIYTRSISKIQACKNCNKALICGGGCPLELALYGKDIYQPNCKKMKYTQEKLLPYLLENNEQDLQNGY